MEAFPYFLLFGKAPYIPKIMSLLPSSPKKLPVLPSSLKINSHSPQIPKTPGGPQQSQSRDNKDTIRAVTTSSFYIRKIRWAMKCDF